jgi:hypothetical protein
MTRRPLISFPYLWAGPHATGKRILTTITDLPEVQNMPILCDFIEIIGNTPQTIPIAGAGTLVPLPDFNTGGRETGPGRTALLMLSARNLDGSAFVFINDKLVATINAAPGPAFSVQMISLAGSDLRNGNNEIALARSSSFLFLTLHQGEGGSCVDRSSSR